MKATRVILMGGLLIASASLTSACNLFESDAEEETSEFYVPDDEAARRAKAGGENIDLNTNEETPGDWGNDVPGGNDYDGFGTRISGVDFESVFFFFDQNNIPRTEEYKVNAVADYLNANPAAGVVIEGNCDERGTEEYNRGLGQRRALSAQDILIASGINESRIKSISYGEERPKFTGATEDAFQQNRRVDFIPVTIKK